MVTSLSEVHKVLDVFLDVTQLQRLPDLLVQLQKIVQVSNSATDVKSKSCYAGQQRFTSSLVTHCWDSWLRCVHTMFLRKFIRSFACDSNTCWGETPLTRLAVTRRRLASLAVFRGTICKSHLASVHVFLQPVLSDLCQHVHALLIQLVCQAYTPVKQGQVLTQLTQG